jgi:hypothetical protein
MLRVGARVSSRGWTRSVGAIRGGVPRAAGVGRGRWSPSARRALSSACCQRTRSGVYFCAFLQFCSRVTPAMEINPILNAIKDLTERTQAIRGYL